MLRAPPIGLLAVASLIVAAYGAPAAASPASAPVEEPPEDDGLPSDENDPWAVDGEDGEFGGDDDDDGMTNDEPAYADEYQLTLEQKKAHFTKMDTDKNAMLSHAEIQARLAAVHKLEHTLTDALEEDPAALEGLVEDEMTQEEFQEMDADHDGFITESEALHELVSIGEAGQTIDDMKAELGEEEYDHMKSFERMERARFKAADEDHDGKLQHREYVFFRHKAMPDIDAMAASAEVEAKWLLRKLDTDNDGHISESELEAAKDVASDGTHSMGDNHHEHFWNTVHPSHLDPSKEEL